MMDSTSAARADTNTVRLESSRELFFICCVMIFDYISESIKRQMGKIGTMTKKPSPKIRAWPCASGQSRREAVTFACNA
jgi:hypothetical protein